MIRGINDKGEIKTAAMTDDGKLKVEVSGGGSGDNQVEIVNEDTSPVPVKLMSGVTIPENFGINNSVSNPIPVNITNEGVEINNESSNPIPVSVTNQVGGEEETTIKSDLMTVGTTSTNIKFVQSITYSDVYNESHTYPIPDNLEDFSKDICIFVSDVYSPSSPPYIYCYDSSETGSGLWGSSASQIKLDGKYKLYILNDGVYSLSSSSSSSSSTITIGSVGKIIFNSSEIKVSGETYRNAMGTNPYKGVRGKKITSVDIANYSEEGTVTITAGDLEAEVGNSLAATLPINKELISMSVVASEADTPVQIIVKGVE